MGYRVLTCLFALCGVQLNAAMLPPKIAREVKGYEENRNQVRQKLKQDYLDVLASLLHKYREEKLPDKAAVIEQEIQRVNALAPGEPLTPQPKEQPQRQWQGRDS